MTTNEIHDLITELDRNIWKLKKATNWVKPEKKESLWQWLQANNFIRGQKGAWEYSDKLLAAKQELGLKSYFDLAPQQENALKAKLGFPVQQPTTPMQPSFNEDDIGF